MRNRLIALALLVVVIVVLAVVFTRRGGSGAQHAVPLTHIAPATVTRLAAAKLDKPLFTLRRQGERWVMLSPKKGRTDEQTVKLLLSMLGENTARQYSPDAIDLGEAELDPPLYTLKVNGVKLEFGSLNPTTLLRYVRRGDTVYAVMDHIAPLLAGGASTFLAPPTTSVPHAGTAGG
jgi:hypothetical protein